MIQTWTVCRILMKFVSGCIMGRMRLRRCWTCSLVHICLVIDTQNATSDGLKLQCITVVPFSSFLLVDNDNVLPGLSAVLKYSTSTFVIFHKWHENHLRSSSAGGKRFSITGQLVIFYGFLYRYDGRRRTNYRRSRTLSDICRWYRSSLVSAVCGTPNNDNFTVTPYSRESQKRWNSVKQSYNCPAPCIIIIIIIVYFMSKAMFTRVYLHCVWHSCTQYMCFYFCTSYMYARTCTHV